MKKLSGYILGLTLLLIVTILLSSCTAVPEDTSAPAVEQESVITEEPAAVVEDQTTEAEPEEERILVLAYPFVPGGFDSDAVKPGTWEAVVNLNEPLLRYDTYVDPDSGVLMVDSSTILPNLATSWEVSNDGTVYTFTLKQGVLSSYGNEFTADDVIWSWDKSADQSRTGAFMQRSANVESWEAIDDYTVRFTLSSPTPTFLSVLTHMTPGLYDMEEMEKHTTVDDPWALEWLAQNYAGFGAYMLESLSPGEEAVFVVNPNYHKDPPYFDRVIFREVPEESSRATLVAAGRVDIAGNLPERDIVDFRQQGLDDVLNIYEVKNTNSHARIMLNPNFEPWDDIRVRQALAYAIDHETIVDIVFQGMGEVSKSPLAPVMDCYTPEHYIFEQDIDRARELLAEAGYPDGVDATIIFADRDVWEEPMAIQVQASAKEAGFNIELERITGAEILSRGKIGVRDMPAFTMGYRAVILDPVYSFIGASVPDGAANRNDYNNPEFLEALDAARLEDDRERRCELLGEAQRIHLQDAHWIADSIISTTLVTSQGITGWVWYPDLQVRWVDLYR